MRITCIVYMRNIIVICLTTLILLSQANGNIVDQLTELNNLYKSGAINEDEFSKAKNILLKSEDDEKSDIEEKITTEKTAKRTIEVKTFFIKTPKIFYITYERFDLY